jgi:16S rRNA (cytosine967-C5)-methyltransferase
MPAAVAREITEKGGARSPRVAAVAALAAVRRGAKLDAALTRVVRGSLDRRDASFAEELVKSVVRHKSFLDYQLTQAAAKPLRKAPAAVLDIMRVGAADLFFLNTPAYAAVDQAVAQVNASRYAALAPFVNGVLRRLASWEGPATPDGDDAARLAVAYSHPEWLVRRWLERLGPAECEELLRANNEPAPLNVYANPARASREELSGLLSAEGCAVTDGPFDSLAVTLGDKGLAELDAFREGSFVVLDPASTIGPRALAPPAGATVWDLCAGVGGKAAQLSWAVGPGGWVVAVDADGRKLKACAAAAARLGLENIEIRKADILKDELPRADFVFLDVPCTNLGVIRRKPDVKWRVHEEDVAAAAATQEAMLVRVADVLAPGGTVVYNVCSFEPEENERAVQNVLARAPLEHVAPGERFVALSDGRYLRTWPHRHGCNGGFVAVLRRRR